MLQDERLLADHGKFVTPNGGAEVGHGFINCAVLHFEGVRLAVWVFWELLAKLCAAVDSVVVVVGAEDVGVHVYPFPLLHVLRVVDPCGPHHLRLHCIFP